MHRKPWIVDRYLVAEFTGPFLLALLGVTLLMLSDTLFALADWLIVKKVPARQILQLLAYRLPGTAIQALPVAVLFGALLAFSRLARDSELVVLGASGVSLQRLMLPVALLALVLSAGAYVTGEYVVPWANHNSENIIRRIVFQQVSPDIREGVFFKAQDNTVFYIRRIDRSHQTMSDVLIFKQSTVPFPQIITAHAASYTKGLWHLASGVSREIDQRGFVTNEASFASLDIKVDEDISKFFGSQKTTEEMNRRELETNIRLFGRSGVDVRPFLVDYHLKLAVPFASLFFTLLGLPLALWGLRRPRRARWVGAGVAAALALTYYVITPFCRSLGVNGLLTPALAAWLPSILFVTVGIFFFTRLDTV